MGIKEVAVNRKARFDYFIEETFEAGISLSGSEVKSAKMGHINVADAFCFIEKAESRLKIAVSRRTKKDRLLIPIRFATNNYCSINAKLRGL